MKISTHMTIIYTYENHIKHKHTHISTSYKDIWQAYKQHMTIIPKTYENHLNTWRSSTHFFKIISTHIWKTYENIQKVYKHIPTNHMIKHLKNNINTCEHHQKYENYVHKTYEYHINKFEHHINTFGKQAYKHIWRASNNTWKSYYYIWKSFRQDMNIM